MLQRMIYESTKSHISPSEIRMSDIILQFQIAEKETFHHKYEALTSTSLNPTNASFRLLPSSVRRILQSVIAKV